MKQMPAVSSHTRIVRMLVDQYQVEIGRIGTTLAGARLADLALDSLSLLSFLAELEEEFGLNLDELRSIARRECPMRELIDVCENAEGRAVRALPPQPQLLRARSWHSR